MADPKLVNEVKEAILKRLLEVLPNTASGAAPLKLAEAYAWLESPRQSHSGTGDPSK